jgi:hypothetical protein
MKTRIQLGIFIAFFLFACDSSDVLKTADNEIVKNDGSAIQNLNRDVRPVVLGSKKENPYTVKNMKAALDTLRSHPQELSGCLKSASALDDVSISATDLYVRFLPNDSVQFSRLNEDTTLTLFDYPLDYSITQVGDYYFDPTVTGPYTWLYTRVPVGYTPPEGIKYEVLDELFLYESSPYYTEEVVASTSSIKRIAKARSIYLEDALKTIEAISFFNTGNPYGKSDVGGTNSNGMRKIQKKVAKHFLWKTWYEYEYFPSGNLFVNSNHTMDAQGNATYITYNRAPLKGVKVHFINWFKWNSVYTDQNGYYESDVFYNGDPTYSIYFSGKNGNNSWQIDRVALWALCLWVQKYNMGEHSKDGYSTTIDSTCGAWDACLANNAFYEYMTIMDRLGLTRPSENLQVALRDMSGASSAPLLQNHENYYSDGVICTLFASTLLIGPAGLIAEAAYLLLMERAPDIILSGGNIKEYIKLGYAVDDAISFYYSTIWHELTHASHYKRFEIDKGFSSASSYWTSLIGTEVGHSNNYGKKGDSNWEQVAICEGWAYYREFVMARDYLQGFYPYPNGQPYPKDFLAYFNQLQIAGCQLPMIEKSICNKSLGAVNTVLKNQYPNISTRIQGLYDLYK